MKNYFAPAIIAAAAFLLAAPASATLLTANMSSDAEVPPHPSSATGTATAELVGDMLTLEVVFDGLSGNAVAAHIHCCTSSDTNAMVAVILGSFPSSFPGTTSGTFDTTIDLGAAVYNPAFVTANGGTVAGAKAAFEAALLDGMTYVDIHTAIFPGGDIRGQFEAATTATPEPATLALFAFGGLGLMRRRSRRA
jgi:hypothetical protein